MSLKSYFRHHGRFYISLAAGLATAAMAEAGGFLAPLLLGGDIFFLTFLVLSLVLVAEPTERFIRRAGREDVGIGVVMLLILATTAFFCEGVFVALNTRQAPSIVPLILSGIGAPLGWFVLHLAMGFHYANLHYYDDPESAADDTRDLEFPGCPTPGPWDFFYFSFVIGMTCQVSDVQVKTTPMRRAVIAHGIAAFFFNTVFIAMAVNAAVAMAGS